VTKVIATNWRKVTVALCFWAFAALAAFARQSAPASSPPPQATTAPSKAQPSPAEALFLQLGSVGLDPARVYRARDISLDRAAFHISLNDGVLGFTSDVAGRVTGAFFEGDGEILLTPPNQVERASMMLETGAAILEERFVTAYFRFNDETFAELQPSLTSADNAQDFVSKWDAPARELAQSDALRLFMTFCRFLPGKKPETSASSANDDRYLHARVQGQTKGTFDIYFDSNAPEQVWAAQPRSVEGTIFYDIWTSFSFLPKNKAKAAATEIAAQEGRANALDVSLCTIHTRVTPPTRIDADAVLDLTVRQGGQYAAIFELARTLVIKQVEADGQPIAFIHNPAIEGTQLSRRGNDLVAVVFPGSTHSGQHIKLHFVYGGEVLSEAGPGLLYVGARGTWYPNRGLAMSNFDLEFRYPPGWTLVATGKRTDVVAAAAQTAIAPSVEQVSHWVSERPIPFAGFNLGKYREVTAHAGTVTVAAYGTGGVERGFPQADNQVVVTEPPEKIGRAEPAFVIPAERPSPARNAEMVAGAAAKAVDFFSRRFGPYPYSQLALTQMPGNLSQGWPGLVFLSSMAFLTTEEKAALHLDPVDKILVGTVIAHETAHQWWGDLVTWNDYRDQWVSEGLANYSSMMLLESGNPREFHEVMAKYRDDLLQKNKDGVLLMEDGPVTLGGRLSCSQFPEGYNAISYGRGTWLFHMLRTMMRDAEPSSARSGPEDVDEPFVRGLRRARERYQGQAITTRQLLQVLEEDLPRPLWYEGHKSLDWFYQDWINGTAIPRIELRNVKYVEKGQATLVTGIIVQKETPKDFVTSVPLYAPRGVGTVLLGRVFADGPETPFHVNAPARTTRIVVDPHQTVLARVR
jgi:Peptidase family M1 domain